MSFFARGLVLKPKIETVCQKTHLLFKKSLPQLFWEVADLPGFLPRSKLRRIIANPPEKQACPMTRHAAEVFLGALPTTQVDSAQGLCPYKSNSFLRVHSICATTWSLLSFTGGKRWGSGQLKSCININYIHSKTHLCFLPVGKHHLETTPTASNEGISLLLQEAVHAFTPHEMKYLCMYIDR